MNREKIHAWWVTGNPALNDMAPLQVIMGQFDISVSNTPAGEPTKAQSEMLALPWGKRYAHILDLLTRHGWETVPPEIGCAPLELDASDIQFLGARLRRLFAHFKYPIPHWAHKDDRLLIGIAPTCIGAVLANLNSEQRALAAPARMSDAAINEITLNKLGAWPSFEAQSWACKVAHAVFADMVPAEHVSYPENEVHKAIKPFLSKRDQGRVMGALREVIPMHDPRSAPQKCRTCGHAYHPGESCVNVAPECNGSHDYGVIAQGEPECSACEPLATDEMIDAACAAVPDMYRVDAMRAIEAALRVSKGDA